MTVFQEQSFILLFILLFQIGTFAAGLLTALFVYLGWRYPKPVELQGDNVETKLWTPEYKIGDLVTDRGFPFGEESVLDNPPKVNEAGYPGPGNIAPPLPKDVSLRSSSKSPNETNVGKVRDDRLPPRRS